MQKDIDNEDMIFVLEDEDGNEIEYELLDMIEYDEREFIVGLPLVTDDEGGVDIFEVQDLYGDSDVVNYLYIEDEITLAAVFDIFEKHMEMEEE